MLFLVTDGMKKAIKYTLAIGTLVFWTTRGCYLIYFFSFVGKYVALNVMIQKYNHDLCWAGMGQYAVVYLVTFITPFVFVYLKSISSKQSRAYGFAKNGT